MKSGCTAVAYETITDPSGGLPLLAPMSEVASRLTIEAAGAALRRHSGGRGILLGGVPGVVPARIAIIGGGIVGTHAARMAVGLGADVTILDKSIPRLRHLDEVFQGRVRTRYATREAILDELAVADVVIGAVLVPGGTAPKVISRADLKLMKPGSVIVDVAIATLPFGLALANKGLRAMADDAHFLAGLNIHNGRVTRKAVADSLGLRFVSPAECGVAPH